MRWIPIPETRAGMVLGESVKDSAGRTLAVRGESVSRELIAAIRDSGVNGILAEDVDNSANAPGGPVDARQQQIDEITESIRKKLSVRFRRHREKPVMQTIRTLAEQQLIKAHVAKGRISE